MSYGYEFGTKEHRDCTIQEGRSMAQIRAKEKALKRQRDLEYYRSMNNQNNQQDLVTPYLIKRERVDPYQRNNQGELCLHRPMSC